MGLFLPDSRLEMPELLHPGRKPTGKVAINRDHWAGKYCNFCVINNRGMPTDLATGIVGTGNPVPYTVKDGNKWLDYVGSGDYTSLALGVVLQDAAPTTLHMKVEATVYNKVLFTLQSDVGDGYFLFYYNGGSYLYFTFGKRSGGVMAKKLLTPSPDTGIHDFIMVYDGVSAANTRGYINGAPATVGTPAALGAIANNTVLGARGDGGFGGSSSMEFLTVYTGLQVNDTQAMSLYQDPYQFLILA